MCMLLFELEVGCTMTDYRFWLLFGDKYVPMKPRGALLCQCCLFTAHLLIMFILLMPRPLIDMLLLTSSSYK